MSTVEEVPLPDPRCGRAREVDLGGILLVEFVLEPEFRLGFHRHDASALFLWLEGRMRVDLGDDAWDVATPGEVLVMPAGLPHREYAGREGGRCIMIQGSPESRERAELEALLDDAGGGVAGPVPRALEALGDVVEGRLGLRSRLRARAACLELMASLGETSSGQGAYASPPWLRALDRWVEERYLEPWSLEALGERFGVSPSHLARVYRDEFGRSVGSRIRALRLEHAARRLRDGALAISKVADEAGFADQSHLTRQFRRRFGTTPARYRRTHR